jgi:magnesium and cobalt transporter
MKSEIGESRPRPRWKQWLVEKLDLNSQSHADIRQALQKINEKHILPDQTIGMLQGVLEYGNLVAQDIMIPRSQVDFIQTQDAFEVILRKVTDSGHSRYPVLDSEHNRVIGILLAKDLLKYSGRESSFVLQQVLRSVLMIPESQRLPILLDEFRHSGTHMAVVIDEYSNMAGIITFEDVLEQIVGDIDDEYDMADVAINHVKPQADGRYLVEASTPIAEVNDALGTSFETDEYDTIAGILIDELGKIPQQGEEVKLNGFVFRILAGDKRRIALLEVEREPEDIAA